MTAGALERIVRRAGRPAPSSPTASGPAASGPAPSGQAASGQAAAGYGGGAEPCGLCGDAVPPEHRHVLDTAHGELLCACRSCSVLFDRDGAGRGGGYRLVPRRRMRLDGLSPGDLGVPVGLAFFVPRADGTVLAHYPSPLGATRWEMDEQIWRDALRRCPRLAGITPDVEALLVNGVRGARHTWLVPLDDCYRLVALVRRHWSGLSGGSRVWAEIGQFFQQLQEQGG